MKVIEQELSALKNNISEMWALVHQQIYNAGEAMLTGDKELAYKVIKRERRVNAFELKIDSNCEDIIALYAPVAIDLRFVLAMYKINTNLERLGDFAESITRFASNLPDGEPMDPELIKNTRVEEILKQLLEMIQLAQEAFDKEDSEIASRLFLIDNQIDELNHAATPVIAAYIKEHPERALVSLYMAGVIRKLERFGDHCTNIAEELIFYLDAKVMKHMGKMSQDTED
ncbi:MAG: phosphate signaling complex protein PhoU [Tannerellaceae bacterium]|nr:phosphate signaling complex protein PhoU [Tannerellaceae bacterium]